MEREIIEEIVEEDWYKQIIHKAYADSLDEDVCLEDCPNKGWYVVEFTDEIQRFGLRADCLGDEEEFTNYQEAKEFYDKLEEPKEYRGVYDSDGFRWE